MKKNPELTAQTRQNLMDAFWQLYCEKRLEKITVKEITAKAGYNRGTFYEYFADVYDVLEQIENQLLSGMQDLPPRNLPDDAASLPLDAFILMYEKNRKYYRVLFGDNGDPAFQAKIKNSVKPALRRMLDEKGTADAFELDFTLEYLLSAMIGVISHWFRNQDSPPDAKLLTLMYNLMQQGVMPQLASIAGRKVWMR